MRKEFGFQSHIWLLMLVLALGLTACSSAPTDESITQAIQAKYYSDPQMKNEEIQIEAANGDVTLSGEVSSEDARAKALELADAVPGVKKVNDSMEVKGAEGTTSRPVSRAAESTPRPQAARPPAPAPEIATIPAGEELHVQMIDSVDSKTSQPGSSFQASLYAPVTVGDKVVVPKGATVYVKLVNAKSAGRIKGSSELEVTLDRLEFQGNSIPLSSSTVKEASGSRGKETAKRTVLGGGVGALIGGIAGGGKGAAIGAGIGAGGAMAVQALTHGKEVKIPSETKLDFTLAEPFQVTVQNGGAR